VTGILNPLAVLVLPLLGLLLVLVFVQSRKREARRTNLGLSPSGTPFKLIVVTAIPLALMALAMLRPYAGSTDVTVPTSNDDYMFVVDVSRSMFAKDVPPSRIELAKRKLKDLIDQFTRDGAPHRYGITLFAGYSYLLCPITDDTAVVKQFISEISPEMVTSLGSRLEAGISTALGRFAEGNNQNARILLVSDGEDDQLSLNRVIELIRSRKVRVDVLGVGTTMGTPIELEDGSFVRNSVGSVVNSKLGEDSLKAIAEAGSGVYVRATVDDRDIIELAKASLTLKGGVTQGTRTIRTYDELGSWLALGALLTILGIAAVPRAGTLLRSIVVVLILTNAALADPLSSPSTGRTAYDLYSEGKFKEAAEAFKSALETTPHDTALQQGYASALFKSGNFREAQKLFQSLAAQATNGKDYFENTYNEGNALLSLSRYQNAIDAYTKALDVKPDDERALHNRELAKKLLQEEKNRPTPTPTPTPSAQPSQSPESSPSPNPSPESDGTKAASPSPADSSAPTQSPDASPSGAPTPNPDASPSEDSAPTPNPSAEPSPTKEAQSTRLKESQPEEAPQGTPPPSNPTPHNTAAAEPQSVQEAQAWLESLPESPLLVRRERGRAKPGGQTW